MSWIAIKNSLFWLRYFQFAIVVLRTAPLIIVLLILVEILSVSFVSEPKMLGLSASGWRLLDSLNGTDPTEPYNLPTYNIVALGDDKKKIMPYGLVLIWLLAVRPLIRPCLLAIPRRRLMAISLLHFAVFAFLGLYLYCYGELYSNHIEHWFGETRRGLFSVWHWLGEGVVPLHDIVLSSLYRLSYSINVPLLFFVGLFPASLVVLSLAKKEGQESLWDALSPNSKSRFEKAAPSRKDWQQDFFVTLAALIAGAFVGTYALANEGRFLFFQTLHAVVILVILSLGVFAYLIRRGMHYGDVMTFLSLAMATSVVVSSGPLYRFVSDQAYSLSQGKPDSRGDEILARAGRLVSSMGTIHFNSAHVMDETRRLWETFRLKHQLSDTESTTILYSIWAIRLDQLELVLETPRSLNSLPSVPQLEDFKRAIKRPLLRSKSGTIEFKYSWEKVGSVAADRWRRDVIDQANKIGYLMSLDKFDPELLANRFAEIIKKDTAQSGIPKSLRFYESQFPIDENTIGTLSPLGSDIAKFLKRTVADPVASSNAESIRRSGSR